MSRFQYQLSKQPFKIVSPWNESGKCFHQGEGTASLIIMNINVHQSKDWRALGATHWLASSSTSRTTPAPPFQGPGPEPEHRQLSKFKRRRPINTNLHLNNSLEHPWAGSGLLLILVRAGGWVGGLVLPYQGKQPAEACQRLQPRPSVPRLPRTSSAAELLQHTPWSTSTQPQ